MEATFADGIEQVQCGPSTTREHDEEAGCGWIGMHEERGAVDGSVGSVYTEDADRKGIGLPLASTATMVIVAEVTLTISPEP